MGNKMPRYQEVKQNAQMPNEKAGCPDAQLDAQKPN